MKNPFIQPLSHILFIQPYHLLAGMIFFVSVIAIIVIFMLFYLVKRSRRTARRKQLKAQYSEFISELAICETRPELVVMTGLSETATRLEGWLSDAFARKVLIRELVTTARSMSGTARQNICWFYGHAGLDKDSLARLKGDWHIKARAIQELSVLEQKQYITRIYRHTNNSNELVRNEARVAVVKLTGFEGLRFLDVISYPLTEWQQMCLLHELSQQSNTDFTQLGRWLQSANHSVVEFAIRLVEVYHVFDMHDEVVNCLSHPAAGIRKKAIKALLQIPQPGTAAIFATKFRTEVEEVQLAILGAMQEMGSESELNFLLQCLSHQRDDFKTAAARAIRNIDPSWLTLVKQNINSAIQPWPSLLPLLQREVVS